MADTTAVEQGKPNEDSLAYLSAAEKEAVNRITEAVKDIPLLPVTGTQLTSALSDPSISAQKVAAIISRDPVVAAKTLRLANSAYYGIPNRITTLNHAISMLGVDSIRQMVFSFYFLDMTALKGSNTGFEIERFWRHSMASAFLAEAVARRLSFQMVGTAEAYLAGLVHDLGKYLLFRYDRNLFAQARQSARENLSSQVESEVRVFGTDHAALGGWLAERWNLPLSLIESARMHHRQSGDCINKELVAITMAADRLAIDEGCAYEPGRLVEPLEPGAEKTLRARIPGLRDGEGTLDKLRQIVDADIHKLESFLASFEGAPQSKPDERPRIETKAMELSKAQQKEATKAPAVVNRKYTFDWGNLLISALLPGLLPITRGSTGQGATMLALFICGILMFLLSFNLNPVVSGTGIVMTAFTWIWSIVDCIRSK